MTAMPLLCGYDKSDAAVYGLAVGAPVVFAFVWWVSALVQVRGTAAWAAASTAAGRLTADKKHGPLQREASAGSDKENALDHVASTPLVEPLLGEDGTCLFAVKSRVPLAVRQAAMWVQVAYCATQFVFHLWTATEHGDPSGEVVVYGALVTAWVFVLGGDSLHFRFLSAPVPVPELLRLSPLDGSFVSTSDHTRRRETVARVCRCASPVLPLAALLCALAQSATVTACGVFPSGNNHWTNSLAWLYVWAVVVGLAHAAATPIGVEVSATPPNPEQAAYDLHAMLLFTWFTPLLQVGANKTTQIKPSDLPPLMYMDTAHYNWHRFKEVLGAAEGKDFAGPRRLWLKLWLTTGAWFGWSCFFSVLAVFAPYIQLVSMYIVLKYVDGDRSDGPIVRWAVGGLFIGPVANAVVQLVMNHLQRRVAIRARAALVQLLYRKALRIDLTAQDAKVGEIVNLMSNDINNILMAVAYINLLFVPIPQFCFAVYGLNLVIQPGWLGGLLFLFLVVPFNVVFFGRMKVFQKALLKKKDDRLGVITELLHGVRIIKMCALERGFLGKVDEKRRDELGVLEKLQNNFVIIISVLMTMPTMMQTATFLAQTVIFGKDLDASTAFTTMALMDQLRGSMTLLPWFVTQLIQAAVSLGRINDFLNRSEVDRTHLLKCRTDSGSKRHDGIGAYSLNGDAPDSPGRSLPLPLSTGESEDEDSAVLIQRADFRWGQKDAPEDDAPDAADAAGAKNPMHQGNGSLNGTGAAKRQLDGEQYAALGDGADEESKAEAESAPRELTLQGIDFKVLRGKLVCIYGLTGGGKSSLLAGILGEINTIGGKVCVSGSLAYTPQKAWSQNATVKENILFGYQEHDPPTPQEQRKYRQVVEACSLVDDFKQLARGKPEGTSGDETEIGEKGITLSGGQQQRVALARACYADADIYLLDDPLSAVDAHVAKHLFHKCICGLLATKTRVLVTHQVALTESFCDWVVVVGTDGTIVEQGPPHELKHSGQHLNGMLAAVGKINRQPSAESEEGEEKAAEAEDKAGKKKGGDKEQNKLVEEEDRQQGAPSKAVYLLYVNACGGPWVIGAITLLAIATGIVGYANKLTLTTWLDSMDRGDNPVSDDLWVYMGATSAFIGTIAIRYVAQFQAGLRASRRLHGEMMDRVIRAPTGWFDKTPIGRVINRFSSDMQSIDREAMGNIMQFISCSFMPILSAYVIASRFIYLLALMLLVLIAAFQVAKTYLQSARELKRLDSTAKSPVYAHFTESLNGLSTIRAFDGAADRFTAQNMRKVDEANAAEFYLYCAQRWMSFRLNMLSAVVSGGCGIMVYKFAGNLGVSSAVSGLVLNYATDFCSYMTAAISAEATMEMSMNSVERVGEYCQLPQEAPATVEEHKPPPTWPDAGAIKATKLCLKYESSPALVIKGIDFDIPPRTSVGIVGRTGAGKSTISLALLRILEAHSGSIVIDGIDIASIGLEDLRTRVAVVPQDPVLFTGSIRFNLDPFDQVDDATMREALERVQLTDLWSRAERSSSVESPPSDGATTEGSSGGSMRRNSSANRLSAKDSPGSGDPLEFELSEGGGNLSVGERQLLCLARALLRQSKVLVMDEATANVDPETDGKIQQVIRNELSGNTVLTVAHRLGTIIYYDRVMVLGEGEILEFGTPLELLKRQGEFYKMCDKTGDLANLSREAEKAADARAAAGRT